MPKTEDQSTPTFDEIIETAAARHGLPPRTRVEERRQARPRLPKGLPEDRLSHAETMTLVYGPDPQWDAFDGIEAVARAAWARHRGRLKEWAGRGHRVWGWWRFEAPTGLDWPGYDLESSTLWAAGLLGEAEKVAVERDWKEWFDKGAAPGFAYCAGAGRWLEGDAAREALHRWADIPQKLVEAWTAADPA